ITLYQSGSGRERTLAQSPGSLWNGEALLLTDGEREGENRFTVSARDEAGTAYTFTFHLPFIRRGDKDIVIDTNLPEDRTIRNETDYDLRIRARTMEADGSVFAVIRANGVTLTLDGEKLEYTGASGEWLQYKLYAKNPPEGDDNTHVLVIHARDDYGNETTETIELLGQRTEDGQKIGTAHIYIDMSALGLGTTSRIAYDVLSGEPISYVVAKAVWGYDAGEPYGTARETFGWDESDCSYGGKLDQGFYLAAMGDGSDLSIRAKALSGDWRDFGSTEEEILAAIDRRFGAGSGMASLWRCLYRNGIELRGWDDHHTVGEFDFTNGSGWLYQLDGEFYPGSSMSDYTLQDGSVLVLRYTLAYGWDVSEGLDGNQGNTVGYCARAINGRIQVNHRVEDGVCVSCGLRVGDCTHDNAFYRDNGDGTCGLYCPDCGDYVQDLQEHAWLYTWEPGSEEHTMTCQNCGASGTERHELRAGEGTATCTEPGTALFTCDICGMAEERETPALGHETGDSWQISGQQHWKQCDRCHEELEGTRADHDYQYNAHSGTWICAECLAVHAWECGDDSLELVSETTSLRVYRCSHCGLTLEQEGDFPPEPELPPPDPDPGPEGPEEPGDSGGDPPEDGE
ncbi:MAG: phage terminase large subunit family protein, partial [Clostridia bacterium]|nr:phage terminase large subunit family protein [Clostridia bacterium]